jgi:hypothetical protein
MFLSLLVANQFGLEFGWLTIRQAHHPCAFAEHVIIVKGGAGRAGLRLATGALAALPFGSVLSEIASIGLWAVVTDCVGSIAAGLR